MMSRDPRIPSTELGNKTAKVRNLGKFPEVVPFQLLFMRETVKSGWAD